MDAFFNYTVVYTNRARFFEEIYAGLAIPADKSVILISCGQVFSAYAAKRRQAKLNFIPAYFT